MDVTARIQELVQCSNYIGLTSQYQVACELLERMERMGLNYHAFEDDDGLITLDLVGSINRIGFSVGEGFGASFLGLQKDGAPAINFIYIDDDSLVSFIGDCIIYVVKDNVWWHKDFKAKIIEIVKSGEIKNINLALALIEGYKHKDWTT